MNKNKIKFQTNTQTLTFGSAIGKVPVVLKDCSTLRIVIPKGQDREALELLEKLGYIKILRIEE
jgi:hypothetical protein